MSDTATNPEGTATSAAGQELRQFVERFERLEAEKKDIADAQKEVMAEAKGRGYDTKVLRKVIAIRKRDAKLHAQLVQKALADPSKSDTKSDKQPDEEDRWARHDVFCGAHGEDGHAHTRWERQQ